MSFNKFDFHPKISTCIQACGFTIPTPIQEQSIPAAMLGRDILGLAQTGTGKTAAFVLPILQSLLGKQTRSGVRALIMAPTRELALQIHDDITRLSQKTGIKCVTVYGGVGKAGQLHKIRAGVDIIVACPGRLLDFMGEGAVKLDKVEHLVLDEADHMFDMGFLPSIKRILRALPAKRQNLLFSATMPSEIRHLSAEVLRDPIVVQVEAEKSVLKVSQSLFQIDQNRKTTLLKKLMADKPMGTTLVFTRTKHKAKNVALQLQKAGYSATSLQGNLSQQQRQRALEGFKNGDFKILVATDIAARGIDVSGISHVINYDVPDTVEAYTHRIGRTGRAGREGAAYTFAGHEDGKIITQIERYQGKKLVRLDTSELIGTERDNDVRDSEQRVREPEYKKKNLGARHDKQGQRPAKCGRPGGGRKCDRHTARPVSKTSAVFPNSDENGKFF
ncbi:MAG: DEAD/DEAH box helicase [Desulfobulbaceae bacterium]|nr:DEAD/DEAH box helicase [Desulfobulbaceae bacterium]